MALQDPPGKTPVDDDEKGSEASKASTPEKSRFDEEEIERSGAGREGVVCLMKGKL